MSGDHRHRYGAPERHDVLITLLGAPVTVLPSVRQTCRCGKTRLRPAPDSPPVVPVGTLR